MNPQFFESQGKPLFGMYHPTRGNSTPQQRAVVICSPIGQEYVRTHWSLRLLAGQLARRGVAVLRFDYAGQGDSAAMIDDIESIDQWQTNIHSAIEFLRNKTAAPSAMLLGLRTGAMLAAEAAVTSQAVNSVVLWEPVHSGAQYLAELRTMHADMLDMWSCKMETENSDNAEEILGSRYSRSLINELENANLDWNQERPHVVFDTQHSHEKYKLDPNPMRKLEFTDDESSWTDLKQLETAWLRAQTTRQIVDQVVNTFDRLERFGILETGAAVVGA